jgi:ubiquitin-protein ligase
MNPRHRRLLSDLHQMQDLATEGRVSFRTEGDPPDLYHLMFSVPGLARAPDGALVVRNLHRCDAFLHLEYPRRPPVLTWLTPVFHPNLLPPARNGGVCLGSWSAAESLADLCRRLLGLVSYAALNPADALDVEAGTWATHHGVTAGSDPHDLISLDPDVVALPEVRIA